MSVHRCRHLMKRDHALCLILFPSHSVQCIISDWQKKSWYDVADGRDHTPCCRQRGVQEICYGLCVHNSPGPLDPAYLACMQDTAKVVMCYQEGLGK